MSESSTNSQPQSPLLALALETQLQIYEEVVRLNWKRIHIVPEQHWGRPPPERFTYVPCKYRKEEPHQPGKSRYFHSDNCDIPRESQSKFSAPAGKGSKFSLFLVCRQIYIEAIPLLYSTPTFSFSEFSHATRFLDFLPRQYRECIQELHISGTPERDYRFLDPNDYLHDPHMTTADLIQDLNRYSPAWEGLCSTLAELKGLQEVKIFLDNARIQEPWLFEPLQAVRVKPDGVFSVRIPRAKMYSAPRPSYDTTNSFTWSDLQRHGIDMGDDGSKMPVVIGGIVMPFTIDRRQWPDQDWGGWGQKHVEPAIEHEHPRRRWKWRIVTFPFKLLHDLWKKRRATS